ncbi:MAG: hypothetical protein KF912_05405 [Phycisphaeraceae bacterium]|nr:hypothetical protein [Phycisphaeraceae bacterium]MBX3366734.1 hypothetical protein [Phycisphaeraceae bacterium]QYK46899.1 MAG: hypothetical protein KF838_08885 [Phycisphaeraceae bacterium]
MSAISRRPGASVCFECKPGCERSPYSERLVFERRGATRSPVEGRAMAAFTDPSGAVSIAYVDLIDESAEGLGIACEIDVAVGSAVTLYNLPRSTSEKGTVVRSQRGAGVSRIGCRVSYSRVAA